LVDTSGILVDALPTPVTHFSATPGVDRDIRESGCVGIGMVDTRSKDVLPANVAFRIINEYVSLSADAKPLLIAIYSRSTRSSRRALTNGVARWETARTEFEDVIKQWEGKPMHMLNAHQIMEGIQNVIYGACIYFTGIQLTLPAASISEPFFTTLFQGAARRAGMTTHSVLLPGY
ncbi:pyruvate, phosphate dikinase, partial [Clostridioides difficile]